MQMMYSSVTVGLIIIALSFDVGLPQNVCPYSCTCTKVRYYWRQYEVNCKNKGLTLFPSYDYYPTDTRIIDLQNNSLTLIEPTTFQELPKLVSIDLWDNEITTIEPGAFQDLPALKYLYLGNNAITKIDNVTFQDLPALSYLYLPNNQIKAMEPGSFQNNTRLSYLKLQNNKIATLELGLFQDLPSLKDLNLTNNQITSLQQGSYQDLPALQNLYLMNNRITSIQKEAFQDLPALESLNLKNNQITSLQQGSFQDLPALQNLYLMNNRITSIYKEAFKDLLALENLYLMNSRITTIHTEAFQGLPALENLNLTNNQITSLQQGSFQDLPALKNINLNNNQITLIQQGAFKDLPSLENLHLEYNNINVIEDNAFINMPEQLIFYLEGNAIAGIDGGVFQGQHKFQEIRLQYNRLQTIRRDTFSGYTLNKMSLQYCSIEMLKPGAFSEVTDINIIHIEDNNITELVIGVFVFQNQPFLNELRLSRNRLSFLKEKTFDYLPNIVNLYLDANEIVHIEIDSFYNLERLQLLDLNNNKIAVIERLTLYGIQNCLQLNLSGNNMTFVKHDIFDDIDDLKILDWSDNQLTTIEQGTFQSLHALKEIHLNNNQLITIQQGAFHDLPYLYKLYLNKNQIATLQRGTFGELPALYMLDIRHNNISVIERDVFINLTRLYILYLSGNNLTLVQNDTFEQNYYLRYLFIDFVCDCNVPFWSWLKTTKFLNDRVTCLDTNYVAVSRRYSSDFDSCTYSANHCEETMDNYNTNWSKTAGNTLSILPCSGDNTSNTSRFCKTDGQWEEPNYSNCIELSNLCAENMDKLHTNWTITAESTLVTLGCSGDYTGNVSRYCGSDGNWEEPNYSNCVRKSIQHIKEQTARLFTGVSDYNIVTIILKDLENVTRDNNELRSGDLLTSSSILTDIAEYVTDHREKLSVEQLEIFASLCNNLIDERNRQLWEELIDGGSGGATPLVNAVTEFNDAFNDVIDSNFSLVAVKENVVMEVGKTSSDEIIVPDRSKTNVTWLSDSGTEIKLTLQKNICTGMTGYSSTFYRNISRLFPEYLLLNGTVKAFNGSYDVNSIIADFTIHGSSCSNYTVIMKFDHLLENYIRPFCGHWDFNAPNTSNGAWSSFGSRLVDAEDSYTICEYNHTTNFAILMSPGGRPLYRAHHFPLSLISAIGCGVSILFLIITIIIHVVFWRDVSDDGTKVLMNLCVALIISYVIFLAGITQTENEVVCSAIAVAMHYMFLTDFALMLAEGILFVKMVVFIFNKRSIVNQLIPPCWIVPAVIVGISAGVTKLNGYGNHKYCWLSPETNLIWAFIGPALLVITINVIVIIITVYKMMTVKAVAAKTPKEKSKIGLKGIRVMLPLFGVTWVLGTFSLNDDLVMFQYLFSICNSLQGLFIFVFNCCLTDKIRKGYREYKRRRANQMDLKLSTECTNNDNLKTAHRRQNVYTEEMDDTL